MTHHAKVAADFWRLKKLNATKDEQRLIDLVAGGIERHDSKFASAEGVVKVRERDWAKFLAVLCDELQDWQRARDTVHPGNDAPWRQFVLETLRIRRDTQNDETTLHLGFVLQDHPKRIANNVGTLGTEAVKTRFRSLLNVLYDNLSTERTWKITLSGEFTSRDVRNAVESISIKSINGT